MKFNSAGPVSKNDPKVWSAPFQKFEAPWVGDLPYMLKNCGGDPRPIRLCVEKTYNFDEIQQRRTCKQKWAKILIGSFSPNLKPLE